MLVSSLSAYFAEVNKGGSQHRTQAEILPRLSFVILVGSNSIRTSMGSSRGLHHNLSKTVLLYQQKASKLPNAGWPVIWTITLSPLPLVTSYPCPIFRSDLPAILRSLLASQTIKSWHGQRVGSTTATLSSPLSRNLAFRYRYKRTTRARFHL